MALFSDILLTADFDRTLTDTHTKIPQRNVEAIRYFIENGGVFTVNTGRSVPMSRIYQDIVPVNAPLLLYNGSAWYDVEKRELCHYYPIDLDPVQVIYDVQSRFPGLNVEIQGEKKHYLYQKRPMWEEYCVHNGCEWDYAEPDKTGPFIKFAIYGDFVSQNTSDMYENTKREAELFRQADEYLRSAYGDKVDLFYACPRILDVHAKGVSKLRTARDLQAHLGRKILVCVGDAENDLSMLEGADYSFCPSDGIVADRFPNVCPCAEGSVAEVIYEKIPEILKIGLDKK
ncbi:MAG: HAD-IIB family hydrolase [Ruminococcaceae bacterium]|nr:HAD-IIB family hydrolase [Oscillospiraceae bacterium]